MIYVVTPRWCTIVLYVVNYKIIIIIIIIKMGDEDIAI